MTHPISNERVEFLRARLKILNECIRISETEMYSMNGGGAQRDDLTQAHRAFNSERIQVMVEIKALEKFGVTP